MMKMLLRNPFLKLAFYGLCFADDGGDGVGGGGGTVTEAEVAAESSAIAADVSDEPLTEGLEDRPEKSDWDILNDEDPTEEEINKPEGDEGDKPEGDTEQDKTEEADKDKTEEEKNKEAQKPEGEKKEDEPGVKALREAIDKDASVKAALDKNPSLRNKLFTDARRSARLNQYTEHFATPELAKTASEDLGYFDGFEKAYTSTDPQGPKQMLTKLLEADFIRGNDGKPVMENGQPKLSGNYARLVTAYRNEGLYPLLESRAQEMANLSPEDQVKYLGEEFDADTFQAGLKLIKALVGDGRQPTGKQPQAAAAAEGDEGFDESTLPENIRKQLEKGRAAETQQREGEAEKQTAFQQAITDGIRNESKTTIKGRVDSVCSAFTEGTRAKIIDDAYSRISKIAKADTAYKRQQGNIQRAYQGDEQKKMLVNLAKVYVAERMTPIVRELAKEYGQGAVADNKAAHEKAGKQTTRKEPITQGGGTTPTRRDEQQLIQRAEKLTRDLYGRGLKESEIMDVDEDFVSNLERRAKARAR